MDSWNVNAFLVLMKIMHCQSKKVPRAPSLKMVAKVAVLADYYDCLDMLSIFAGRWVSHLQPNFPSTSSRELILWLWISWAFRLNDLFRKVTLIAITQSDG